MDRTHEEIRAEYIASMGPDLGELYHELEDETSSLHEKWGEFKLLFDKGQVRIDLLNEVASNFFYLVHQVLFESVLLQLCRLTDPPDLKNYKLKKNVPNLSFRRLPDLISDPSLKTRVDIAVNSILMNCEFARDWRNRRLAHSDLLTVRNQHTSPLPPATIAKVENALESIRDLHALFEEHYHINPVLFPLNFGPWGVESLLHYLENAVRAKKLEEESWRKLAEGDAGAP